MCNLKFNNTGSSCVFKNCFCEGSIAYVSVGFIQNGDQQPKLFGKTCVVIFFESGNFALFALETRLKNFLKIDLPGVFSFTLFAPAKSFVSHSLCSRVFYTPLAGRLNQE